MFSNLLALALVVGQPTPSAMPKTELPKLVDGLTPLKPLSSQGVNIRPVLSAAPALSVQPSLNLPALPMPSIELRVKECERKPNIVGGTIAEAVGRPHKWLVVEDRFGTTIHAPGLGNEHGVPGANGQTSPDYVGSDTYIRDHTKDVPRSCKLLPALDPACVISKTPYNQYVGGFWPYISDCNTFTQRITNVCQLPRLPASPLFDSRPLTVWDKASLLPKTDAILRYRLVDVDLSKPANSKPKQR